MSKKDRKREKRKRGQREKASDDEITQLNQKLEHFNLFVKTIDDDGNCMFRAVADQLYHACSDSSSKSLLKLAKLDHADIRSKCVEFLRENGELYRLFIDEDEDGPWEKYVENMACDSVWGGQLELMAISKTLEIHLVIFQAGMGTLEMRFDEDAAASADEKLLNENRPCCLLAYIGGEHYNSVRLSDSSKQKSAQPDTGDSVLSLQRIKHEIYGEDAWKEMLAMSGESVPPPPSVIELVRKDPLYESFKEQLEECLPEDKRSEIMTREKYLTDIFRRVVWRDETISADSGATESDGAAKDSVDDGGNQKASKSGPSKREAKRTLRDAKKANAAAASKKGSKDKSGSDKTDAEKSTKEVTVLREAKFDDNGLSEEAKSDILKARVDDALEEVLGTVVQ